MLLSLLLFIAFQGDFYYLDGHAFHLRNGVVIKTVAEIKEDRLFYRWQEGDAFLSIEKRNVRTVEFFTLRVPGNRPSSTFRSASRRRISGMPVAYTNQQGDTILKTRHINDRGRSLEGQPMLNRVAELRIAKGADPVFFTAEFDQSKVGSSVELRFYDLEGNLEAKAFLDVKDIDSRTDLRKEKGKLLWQFSLSGGIEVQKIGLVEVLSTEE